MEVERATETANKKWEAIKDLGGQSSNNEAVAVSFFACIIPAT